MESKNSIYLSNFQNYDQLLTQDSLSDDVIQTNIETIEAELESLEQILTPQEFVVLQKEGIFPNSDP